MQWAMAAIVGLVLIGCVHNQDKPVLGPVVDEPIGWSDYCQRHPKDSSC